MFRTPIVLCDLEGRTIKEAAERLGWPPGTVASRLARGRRRLAARLARHGYAVPVVVLTAVLSEAATAGVPVALKTSTMQAALAAAGATAGAGVASAKAALLTEQIMKALLLDKLKGVAAGMTVLVGLCLSAGMLLSSAQGQAPATQGPMPPVAALPPDAKPADTQSAKGAAPDRPAFWLSELTLAKLEPGMLLAVEITAGDGGALTVTSILATRVKR